MKSISKYFIFLLSVLGTINLTSCLEEKEELYEVVGPVATIPVFTASSTTPAPGSVITLTLRYYSPNIAVKELRLNETVGTAEKRQVTTKAITAFNTDNSYVDTFEYTVPADVASGTKIILEAVAVTNNDLVGTRNLTLTIP